MSRSKAKGTAAERGLVDALRRLGFVQAERRALSGANDKGDVTGTPGLCWESKDAVAWKLAQWMRETETERVNAEADYGILVVKVPGIGNPNAEKWLTVMDDDDAMRLLAAASGNGDQPLRQVTLKAVGLRKGLEEMVERERHCGSTPVAVRLKRHGEPGFWNLMRLNARCRLLVDAGYGGHAIMDPASSSTMKECSDG